MWFVCIIRSVFKRKQVKNTYCEVLEQPCPHDIGSHLGEDATLFLPLFVFVWVVIITCTRRGHAVV